VNFPVAGSIPAPNPERIMSESERNPALNEIEHLREENTKLKAIVRDLLGLFPPSGPGMRRNPTPEEVEKIIDQARKAIGTNQPSS
jgi:hypothetical protein